MKKYLITLCLFILALVSSYLSNLIIIKYFPERVVNPDLLMKVFPYSLGLEYLTDIFFFLAIALGIYILFAKINKENRLHVINIIIIFYILRSIINILTPMQRPTGIEFFPSHGLLRDYITQVGMFPSGHVGLVALCYFIADKLKFNNFKKVFLFLLIITAFLMIISMGHYSIDIIGGILLAYIIVNEYKGIPKSN